MDDAPQYIKDKIGFVYSDIYANPDWTIDKLEYYTAPFIISGIRSVLTIT